jgi:hypothetical protein
VYSSQIILGRTSLEKFVSMSHEIRMKYFHDVASERHLVLSWKHSYDSFDLMHLCLSLLYDVCSSLLV